MRKSYTCLGDKSFRKKATKAPEHYLYVKICSSLPLRIFGRVKRSKTRNIRSSVVSDSKLNLRSEREEQDSRIIQDGENLKSA